MNVILFNANDLLYRMHLKNKSNTAGIHSAIGDFTIALKSVLKRYPDSAIMICFNGEDANYRNKLADEHLLTPYPYGSNTLNKIYQDVYDLMGYLGLGVYKEQYSSAGDVITNLSNYLKGDNHTVGVVSSSPVDYTNPYFDVMINPYNLLERSYDDILLEYGGTQNKLRAFFALTGLSVEGVPGVPKVGAKKALALTHFVPDPLCPYLNTERFILEAKVPGKVKTVEQINRFSKRFIDGLAMVTPVEDLSIDTRYLNRWLSGTLPTNVTAAGEILGGYAISAGLIK